MYYKWIRRSAKGAKQEGKLYSISMDLPQTKLTENTLSSFAVGSRQRIPHKNTFSYYWDQKPDKQHANLKLGTLRETYYIS